MSKHGKKYTDAKGKVDKSQVYSLDQALSSVKELSYVKFDESTDVDVVLGIDPTRGEQVVRGAVTLPHGRGKKIKVLVFAKGDQEQVARDAGADYVGLEDLIEKINGGWLDFDFAVATPDLMGVVGKVAKVLGPRGLLPNKKLGTVALDVGPVVENLKKGQMFFKNDKSGIVHFSFGKVSFGAQELRDNLTAFFRALNAAKPASSKGKFLKKAVVSSTMGVGIQINPEEVLRS